MFVDSHCHLDFPDFTDLDAVIERAHAAGVTTMLTISTRVRRFAALHEIIGKYPSVYASIGVHPHQAEEEADITTDDLLTIIKSNPKVVAVGEAGLDYHYQPKAAAAQAISFRAHIEAARQTDLPLIIHAREADADMEKLLVEEMKTGSFKAVLHCFSSTQRLAEVGLELGFMISFSGIVTFKNAPVVQTVAKFTPLNCLLVETDAPYLAPPPYRGQRNEPAYVVNTARFVAQLRDMPFETLAQQTTANFFQYFSRAI